MAVGGELAQRSPDRLFRVMASAVCCVEGKRIVARSVTNHLWLMIPATALAQKAVTVQLEQLE